MADFPLVTRKVNDMALSANAALNKDKATGKATMEHRHFATVAAIIKSLDDSMTLGDVKQVAEHFASELKATNPRFDRNRFMIACGFN